MSEDQSAQKHQLSPVRIKPAEYTRTLWTVTVEPGITRETIESSAFWNHVARKLKPYDRIEVQCDDGTFFGEYLVLSTGRAWAKVHCLQFHKLTNSDVSETQAALNDQDYEVAWKGPHKKFCVVRVSDKEILKDEIPNKDDAYKWMNQHAKTVSS